MKSKVAIVLAAAAALTSVNAVAQEFAKSPANQAGMSVGLGLGPSPANPSGSEVKVLEVTGYGESVDTARRDAVRVAVQQVAGLYIDASRRVDEKVSDSKISTVIEEKVLSYTNAYVDRLDVISAEQRNGLFAVHARIAVNARPLIRTLKDNAIPTASFDARSAMSVVESIAQEKTNAAAVYRSLMDTMDRLYEIRIGKPTLALEILTTTEEAWLKVPITFFVNEDVIRDWYRKMDMIAQKRVSIPLPVSRSDTRSGQHCQVPSTDTQYLTLTVMHKAEEPDEVDGMRYKQICFARPGSSTEEQAECLLRSFPVEKADVGCEDRKSCPTIADAARHPTLNVNLIDQGGSQITSYGIKLEDYPWIDVFASASKPDNTRTTSFMDFCGGHVDLPYQYRVRYGRETLFVPFPGSHIDSTIYVKVPSDKIGLISKVQAHLDYY